MDNKNLLTIMAMLRMRISDSAMEWYDQYLGSLADDFDEAVFAVAFAQVPRQVGRELVDNVPEKSLEDRRLIHLFPATVDEIARIGMILFAAERLDEDQFAGLVFDLFYKGDNRERAAVLASLFLLPKPERFIDIAVEATRSNVQSVFEAICCENPYPAEQFSERNFNQMVIKALSISIALDRILGWQDRNNFDLARMCGDYVSEREKAGRPVSPDTRRIIEDHRSRS